MSLLQPPNISYGCHLENHFYSFRIVSRTRRAVSDQALYSSSDCNFNASRLGVFCFASAEAAALRQYEYESGNSMRDDLEDKTVDQYLATKIFLDLWYT